jgi:hypothetical protein
MMGWYGTSLVQTLAQDFFMDWNLKMGLPENSVPLNPLVNDHYPY